MIRIVQGNPGSGKSYYAVNYLSKFCEYDPLYKDHLLKDGTLVITNVDSIKIKHLNFDELVQRFTIEKFLTIENFEKLIEKYKAKHILLIIDEAQKYLDSKFFDKDVFYFFQYHRHLGIDIFLLTQSVTTICRQLPPLAEFVIEAQPRSKGIVGTFRYKFKDTKGTFMYSSVLQKKNEVFQLYKSFTSDEAEKPKNVLSHWGIVAVVLIVVAVIGFKGAVSAIAGKGKSGKSVATTQGMAPHRTPVSTSPAVLSNVSTSFAPVRVPLPDPVQVVSAPSEFSQYPIDGYVDAGNGRIALLISGKRVLLPSPSVQSYSLQFMVARARTDVFGPVNDRAVFSTGTSFGGASLEPPEKRVPSVPVGKTSISSPA